MIGGFVCQKYKNLLTINDLHKDYLK